MFLASETMKSKHVDLGEHLSAKRFHSLFEEWLRKIPPVLDEESNVWKIERWDLGCAFVVWM